MTERIDHRAHEMAWPGRRIISGDTVPGAGTWEIVEHPECSGHGLLLALIPGRNAPSCAVCGRTVVWQLSHLASSVAADHHGVGRLP